jgi:hypothetical protein
MSGNGDYVKLGDEAKRFFGSIQLKEYKNRTDQAQPAGGWKKYSPSYGGFAVDLPHEPYVGNDGSWIFDAEDKSTGTQYRVMRTDIHNYHFVEEDTFDLGLMNESFITSEFIDSQYFCRQTTQAGFPALDGKYKDKEGAVYLTRFIIQGPHYYTLIAHGKQELPAMKNFLNSFEIKPFIYDVAKQRKDTSLYFSVTTPVFPGNKKIKLDMPRYNYLESNEEEESEFDQLEGGAYRNKTISNDTTGEKIYVSFFRSPRYYYTKDSVAFYKVKEASYLDDSTGKFIMKKKTMLPGNMKPDSYRVWESIVTDTGSSRTVWTKTFYKEGIGFSLATESDTLTQPSAFVKNFYETFTPTDTLKGINPFVKKSNLFFDDFMSNDSLLHKRAVKHMDEIDLDSSDIPRLKKAMARLNWNEKKYLETKISLIGKWGDINTSEASDYLGALYFALDDTVQLQYAALESLLQHKTNYAFNIFRNIINTEPPVLETDVTGSDYSIYSSLSRLRNIAGYDYNNGNFLDELSDSLQLAKTILADLLPLLNLEDYKRSILKLLAEMADSNLLGPKEYETCFGKFMIEAKQELKKQSIAEKKKAIQKAEEGKEEKNNSSWYPSEDVKDAGNNDLSLYARLLLPFFETNMAVQSLIQQMLNSNDKKLKYGTLLLMLQHKKPFPDSLLGYFGSRDEYRYQLYTDLKKMGKADQFPSLYNTHVDLGRSSLFVKSAFDTPDSMVYMDRLPAEYRNKKGFIYFYKYKTRKDDLNWKLATAGLVPEDPKQFEFEDDRPCCHIDLSMLESQLFNPYDFTGFSDTKIEEDASILKQMTTALKKLFYSRRNSAKKFYEIITDQAAVPDYID